MAHFLVIWPDAWTATDMHWTIRLAAGGICRPNAGTGTRAAMSMFVACSYA
jgi:hypothetical protein